jgi:predicted dehydrogenase
MTDDIGFVGTGADPESPGTDGYAMAYRHAAGYERVDGCRLTCCADIVRENAEAFAERHDIDEDGVFEDYERMCRERDPDVMSVCVPPSVHAEVVVGLAETGVPDAIHCEKPMAASWADCRRMVERCAEAGIQLTVNHQRRLGPIFRRAKELLDDGTIGSLRRIEWSDVTLFDAGTHLFDLSMFYTDQAPVEWVLAGVAYHDENKWFGTHNENQAVVQWRHTSGVDGLAVTGDGSDTFGAYIALCGTEGRIELGGEGGPPLRYRNDDTTGWEGVDVGEDHWGNPTYSLPRHAAVRLARRLPLVPESLVVPAYRSHVDRAIENVVESYRSGDGSPLRAELALGSTELIFAAYESVRRRGRVDLPLDVEDNPLESMVESGVMAVGDD